MARMRPGNKEKIRQLKQEIKDMKKDLKDTFAETDEMKKKSKSKNGAVRIVMYAAMFAAIALTAYFIWRFGIVY